MRLVHWGIRSAGFTVGTYLLGAMEFGMGMAYGSLSYVGWVWFGRGWGIWMAFFCGFTCIWERGGFLRKDIWSGAYFYDERMARVCL